MPSPMSRHGHNANRHLHHHEKALFEWYAPLSTHHLRISSVAPTLPVLPTHPVGASGRPCRSSQTLQACFPP
jgi:hypothetical protein